VRRRLIVTYVSLLAVVLLGLSLPLGLVLAAHDAQEMFIDRLDDTARFASLAEPALRTGDTSGLEARLRQYDAMFGIAAAIVNRDSRLIVASRSGLDPAEPLVRRRIDAALSGQQAGSGEAPWPWERDPLIVAVPIGTGGEIIGAAVTVSPRDALTAAVGRVWLALAALSGLALVLGVLASIPLSRWMLRPVLELDEAAQALAGGRRPAATTVQTGPPELRRLTATFHTMSHRITALLDRQRTFASYASHQLRTPLATLRLCVENLGPAVTEAGEQDYSLLSAEITRMTRMCDALLSYALADMAHADGQVHDAGAVVEARVAAWRPALAAAGIEVVRSGLASAAVTVADQALDQALDTLLSNVVKFCGGATVTVTVDRGADGRVEVSVADTGPGLPTGQLARAAEPFWRAPAHQNVDGSGLGITIARALVTASDGSFELQAMQPHGLCAVIRLREAP
jgi:signal transduction histidine kinase